MLAEILDGPIPELASDINDIRNIMSMEAGAHRRFNDNLHVFWPIPNSTSAISVVYYFQPKSSNTASVFHMKEADIPLRIHPYFLYCRFACAIIKIVRKGNFKTFPVATEVVDQGVVHGEESKEQSHPMQDEETGSSLPKSPTDIIMDLERAEARLSTRFKKRFDEYESGSWLCSRILPLTIFLGERPWDSHVWEYEDSYPGMTDVARTKLDYIKNHPQIMETGDAGTVRHEWDLFSSGLSGSST